MSGILTPYIVLPPVGFVSGAVTLMQLYGIATLLPRQKNKPWAYSKFSKAASKIKTVTVSGRVAYTFTYSIPFFAVLGYLYYKHIKQIQNGSIVTKLLNKEFSSIELHEWQSILPHLMTIFHFGKRIFESLFIHISSNDAPLSPRIGINYAFVSLSSLYFQSMIDPSYYKDTTAAPVSSGAALLSSSSPLLSFSSITVGSVLYGIGIIGNFVHHYILRYERIENDKKKGDKDYNKYVIPQNGLFPLTWTPHYLFELIGWYGMGIVSKHLTFHLMSASYTSYLVGRAIATKEWYEKKFDPCPDRSAIFPMIL